MSVEQCNNCDQVERENIILRKMLGEERKKLQVYNRLNEKIAKTIAKAAGVNIVFKENVLPGERSFSIVKSCKSVLIPVNKLSKIYDLVDEETAMKIQRVIDTCI